VPRSTSIRSSELHRRSQQRELDVEAGAFRPRRRWWKTPLPRPRLLSKAPESPPAIPVDTSGGIVHTNFVNPTWQICDNPVYFNSNTIGTIGTYQYQYEVISTSSTAVSYYMTPSQYQYQTPITYRDHRDQFNERYQPQPLAVPIALSAEQLEAARVNRREARERRETTRETTRAAATRALSLFRSSLTPEQLADFDEHSYFYVRGSAGRRYRIRCDGYTGNVDLVDERGNTIIQMCAHPVGLPDADAWISQKLTLEVQEESFLTIANAWSHNNWPRDISELRERRRSLNRAAW
jgi:hypothetical protein